MGLSESDLKLLRQFVESCGLPNGEDSIERFKKRIASKPKQDIVVSSLKEEKTDRLNNYQTLFGVSPTAALVFSEKGLIRDLNPEAAKLFGKPIETLINTSIYATLHEQSKIDFIRFIKLLKSFGRKSITELVFLNADKSFVKSHVQGGVFYNPETNEELYIFHITAHDTIREIIKYKEQVRSHKALYEKLFYQAQTVNLLIDAENGNIADANAAACSYYGYSLDEFKELNLSDINILSPYEIALEMEAAKEQKKQYFNFIHRLQSGEKRHVEVYSKPLQIEDKAYLYSVVYDAEDKFLADKEVQKLTAAVEQSPASIVITDLEGVIEYVNPKFSEVTGYSGAEVYGKRPAVLRTKHTPVETYENLWNSILSGKSWQGEFVNRRKDGTIFYEHAHIAPIINENGQIEKFVAIKEDITERKKAELELSKLNQKLNSLNADLEKRNNALEEALSTIDNERQQLLSIFDSIPELIYVADPNSMEVMYTNKKMQEVMGRDITGEKCYEAIQGKKEACNFCTNKTIFSNNRQPYFWEYYNPILKKDYYIIDRAITWTDGKEVRFEMAVDISTQKQHEIRLEKRLRYETGLADMSAELLSNAPETIENALLHILQSTQVSRVYIFQNTVGSDDFVYTSQTHEVSVRRESAQINNPDLQNIPYRKAGFARWEKLLSQNKIIDAKVSELPESERPLLESQEVKSILIIPIFYKNRWQGFVGFDDISSDREWEEEDIRLLRTVAEMIGLYLENQNSQEIIVKHNKQLQELNATKDKFFSIIAHDLKSPFNAIIGFSSVLSAQLDSNKPEQSREMVETIKNSADKTYKLVENLLEWAGAQSGTISYKPQKQRLHNYILENMGVLSHHAESKGIILRNLVSRNCIVFADANMLNTILRNLIANALKFSYEGGIVSVSAEPYNNMIKIGVADNGVGMLPEETEMLFDISQKFSKSGTANEQGTGLGLILCKEFAEKHGGEIWVESEKNKGSVFYFTLPSA